MLPSRMPDETQRKRSMSFSPSVIAQTDLDSPQWKRNKGWARLLLRELYDLGFSDAAAALEREASVSLRSNAMENLRSLVASCEWDKALHIVTNVDAIQMKSHLATREAALLLLQRKFIDCLLQNQVSEALHLFQEKIYPVYHLNETETQQLAELLLCRNAEEINQRATRPWQDRELQLKIAELVSTKEIVPKGALRKLVHNVNLQESLRSINDKITGHCDEILKNHKSEVWELAFSPDGEMLASASSDGSVVLWDITIQTQAYSQTTKLKADVNNVQNCHEGPVNCLAWSLNSRFLLSSGSHSNIIQLWDRTSELYEKHFQHPRGIVTKLLWLSCRDQFVSGSADNSLILWNARDGSIIYQWSGRRVLDIVAHPHDSKLFVLVSGHDIRVYNTSDKSDELFLEAENLTSCLAISPCGKYLLANLIKLDQIACFDVATGSVVANYGGVRVQRYVLRPCFIGNQSEFVTSGSEDGKIFLWQRCSGELAAELVGHSSVVNVVARHPIHSSVLASAGDDKTVRLWSVTPLMD